MVILVKLIGAVVILAIVTTTAVHVKKWTHRFLLNTLVMCTFLAGAVVYREHALEKAILATCDDQVTLVTERSMECRPDVRLKVENGHIVEWKYNYKVR